MTTKSYKGKTCSKGHAKFKKTVFLKVIQICSVFENTVHDIVSARRTTP